MSEVDPFSKQPSPPEEATPSESSAPKNSANQYDNKNIIVCCDGTGNEFAGKDAKDSNSNVVKLYTALKLDKKQFAYYHPGVGTMGDPTKSGIKRQMSVVNGLAFGEGFRDNVLDAYRYLMQHYNAGDKVFIFGFSRGAYTARALGGLLHGYGLLCRGNEGHIPYAWRMYTAKVQEQLQQNRRSIETDFSFRDTFSHKDFIIQFMGLWDTVSSVGWVSTPVRLLHLAQNPTVIYGRHAISIDERRSFFQDNLWGDPVEVQVPTVFLEKPPKDPIPKMQDIRQVWFSGVHSDVGGSYPQLESGLSNITLKWMLEEAEKFGLHYDSARRKLVLGEPLTAEDDPHGLTEGIAPLYEKPKKSKLHNSLTAVWWITEVFPHRYYTRDDSGEKMRIPLGARRRLPTHALVHPSVMQRMTDKVCYRPANVEMNELVLPAAPTPENPEGFYVFEPIKCRDGDWRENWFVVFLVSMLEIAAGLLILKCLLVGLGHLTDWLLQLSVWSRHHVLPKDNLTFVAKVFRRSVMFLRGLLSPRWRWIARRFWPLALATIFLAVRSVVASVRRMV